MIQAQGQAGSNQKSAIVVAAGPPVVGSESGAEGFESRSFIPEPTTTRHRRIPGTLGHEKTNFGHSTGEWWNNVPMSGANLTRTEAADRARNLDVHGYDVELDLSSAPDKATTTFLSTTVIRFAASEGTSTFADLIAPAVREIELNGNALDPDEVYADCRIRLDGLLQQNELRVVADCAYMTTGEGLHRFTDPVDGHTYLYTQFEVPDARRVFTTFEQPDLKATFTLTVRAPTGWQVISNSPTPSPTPEPTGDQGGASDATAVWRFEPTPRISTYLTALVAGPYHVVRDSYAGRRATIPMGVFCRQSLAEHLDAEEVLDITKKGFEFFEDEFGYPYPFEKYDQLFVPEYNMGAIENPGCVTLRDEYVFRSRRTDAAYEGRAVTILHELAHMWFGDLVTMRWWDDLWLNESFATYASQLCLAERTRWTEGWTSFTNSDKTWALRQDQLPSTHPIVADIEDLNAVAVNFDGITYAKGASVLKQLVAYVGREEFFAGLRHYFKRYEWRNATLADLKRALEETSGRDLEAWSAQWLETAGVNTLRPEFRLDQDGKFASFAVLQSAVEEYPTLRSHRIAIGLYDRTDAGLVRRERFELDVAGERTDVPELIGVAQPDLVLLNEDDLTFAKLRLDERSLATLQRSIHELTSSLARALCWGAAWDMCRDAELPAREYAALVLTGLPAERDINMFQLLLGTGTSAVQNYTTPQRRAEAQSDWANGLLHLLREADAGSDQQLALARSFAAAATPEHAEVLRELSTGARPLPGLTIDAELRWALVQALARLGSYGDAEIDATLADDNTASGAEEAAQARASRPSAAAKEEAWRLSVDADDVPNQTQFKIIRGFWQSGQEQLLAPYVQRYLDAAGSVWQRKGHEMAQAVLKGLFPKLIVSTETIQTVEEWLEAACPEPAVHRLVSEGVADLRRALQAQACDATAG